MSASEVVASLQTISATRRRGSQRVTAGDPLTPRAGDCSDSPSRPVLRRPRHTRGVAGACTTADRSARERPMPRQPVSRRTLQARWNRDSPRGCGESRRPGRVVEALENCGAHGSPWIGRAALPWLGRWADAPTKPHQHDLVSAVECLLAANSRSQQTDSFPALAWCSTACGASFEPSPLYRASRSRRALLVLQTNVVQLEPGGRLCRRQPLSLALVDSQSPDRPNHVHIRPRHWS